MSSTLREPGPWRFDDLDALPDDGRRYEVVDGKLLVTPPPTPWHQYVASSLQHQLAGQCPSAWRVLHELGLPLGTDGRVPDLAVISAAASLRARHIAPQHFGLVVEVVSASSRKTDRFAEPGEYAEAGIPLLWRVETEPDLLLLAHRLVGDRYEQVAVVDDAGDVPAPWGAARIDLAAVRDTAVDGPPDLS